MDTCSCRMDREIWYHVQQSDVTLRVASFKFLLPPPESFHRVVDVGGREGDVGKWRFPSLCFDGILASQDSEEQCLGTSSRMLKY